MASPPDCGVYPEQERTGRLPTSRSPRNDNLYVCFRDGTLVVPIMSKRYEKGNWLLDSRECITRRKEGLTLMSF